MDGLLQVKCLKNSFFFNYKNILKVLVVLKWILKIKEKHTSRIMGSSSYGDFLKKIFKMSQIYYFVNQSIVLIDNIITVKLE